MIGLHKIERTEKTLAERGLPEGSLFELYLDDGTIVSEVDVNWSSISERRLVEYLGGQRSIMVCRLPVVSVRATHEGLSSSISIGENEEVYQGVRSETLISGGEKRNRIIGRFIGKIRGNGVVEEHFLNGLSNEVEGFRK